MPPGGPLGLQGGALGARIAVVAAMSTIVTTRLLCVCIPHGCNLAFPKLPFHSTRVDEPADSADGKKSVSRMRWVSVVVK